MTTSFLDLISKMTPKKGYNEEYYCFSDFKNLINELFDNDIKYVSFNDDYILTPFYLCPNCIYEMYWFDLRIAIVDEPSFTNYLLRKTASTNIEMVDESVVDNLKSKYIEIIKPKSAALVTELDRYVCNMLYSASVESDVKNALKINNRQIGFDNKNLYFAVY